jgi:hypothetical protein
MSPRATYRAGLAELARNWLAQRPLYLACAATGTGPVDELIALAVLEHDGEVLIDTALRPARQGVRVLAASERPVATAPSFAALAPRLGAHLAGRALIAYDATFALRLLLQSAHRHGCPQPPARSAYCAGQLIAAWHGDWDGARHAYRCPPPDEAAALLGLADEPPPDGAREAAALTRRLLHRLADPTRPRPEPRSEPQSEPRPEPRRTPPSPPPSHPSQPSPPEPRR